MKNIKLLYMAHTSSDKISK